MCARPLALVALFVTALSGCTAHYPINEAIEQAAFIQDMGAAPANSTADERSESIAVLLAFSGGGTRAAAFSYGVMKVLAETRIEWDGRERRLIDEVDTISSVSGGSFTAAYYGLFGDRIFEDFEERFLKKDVQGTLTKRFFSPFSWGKIGSGRYNRSEMAADYYDEILFEHKTFADIYARDAPLIQINATDIGLGVQFPFIPFRFAMICSDLASFPVSRAVTASSAVPILFSSVTIRNYAGSCGFKIPAWAEKALQEEQTESRTYHVATRLSRYLDSETIPYIHLYDGGLTDNLGLRPFIDRFALAGGAWELAKIRRVEDIRRVLIIAVNAQAELHSKFVQTDASLSLAETVGPASAIPLNEYSFETLTVVRAVLRNFDQEIAAGRCAERKQRGVSLEDCDDIRHYLVVVDFNELADKAESTRLKRLPTSFSLAPEEVDNLRDAAIEIMQNSKEFQRFLRDMHGRISDNP
jgi:NTE family protein